MTVRGLIVYLFVYIKRQVENLIENFLEAIGLSVVFFY